MMTHVPWRQVRAFRKGLHTRASSHLTRENGYGVSSEVEGGEVVGFGLRKAPHHRVVRSTCLPFYHGCSHSITLQHLAWRTAAGDTAFSGTFYRAHRPCRTMPPRQLADTGKVCRGVSRRTRCKVHVCCRAEKVLYYTMQGTSLHMHAVEPPRGNQAVSSDLFRSRSPGAQSGTKMTGCDFHITQV